MSVQYCPHCSQEIVIPSVHVPLCPCNPANYDRTRAALDDGTGCIRGMSAYRRDRRDGLSATSLYVTFASWRAVAEYFALEFHQPENQAVVRKHLTRWDRMVAEIGAENDALRQETDAILEQDLEAWCALPVARVIETPTEIRYILR